MTHQVKHYWTNEDKKNQVICTCGARSPWTDTSSMARDWFDIVHVFEVEQLRASLGTRTPSLSSQRDYYQKMADDPRHSEGDRRLWHQLADELSLRVNNGVPPQLEELPLLWD